nr:YdeI/OmpD-associated family protein [Lewinella sp. IMCC34183]
MIKFTKTADIKKLTDILASYIAEAIEIERSGKQVVFNKRPEPVPEELSQQFAADPAFKTAFYALTPGRQRGYIIHFSQPKQAQTRTRRIEKYRQQILEGVGLHDHYKS